MRYVLLFVIFVLFYSCVEEVIKDEKAIARVFDTYLYPSDLADVFPKNMGEEDSLILLKSLTEKWIRKQLLLNKAELNLTEQQKDVSSKLNDYRASLLIYEYKRQLINQKVDTIISNKEVEEYYSVNQPNFILDKNIIKGLFLKIPKTAPNIENVRKWYKSSGSEEIIHLEDYCYQFAAKYDYFDDNWIVFENLLEQIPYSERNQERFLRYRKHLEVQDSLFYYFLNIKEFKLKSELSPIEFVRDDIKSIILNKRRINFEAKLETDIFNESLKRNDFEIIN